MANKDFSSIKVQIAKSIIKAAKIYKEKMVGYSFLYVFEGHAIQVVFRAKDFMHMTGVNANCSAEQFYRNAVKGILRPEQFYFNERHPVDLCIKKTSQLVNLSLITSSDILMLEDLKTKTFTYIFGLTDLTFTVCLTKDTDLNGNIISDHYVVRSIRVEDSFDRADNAYEVHFIFSHNNGKHKYNKIMYADQRYSIESLPAEILEMLDKNILNLT